MKMIIQTGDKLLRYPKLLKSLILLILFSLFLFSPSAFAQSCSSKDECQKLIEQYEQKLTGVREQKNTLASQITLMDTQIALTNVKIQDTQYNIKKTGDEIESLTGKIDNLNSSLDYLGKVFLKKVVDGYKRRKAPIFDIFLDSTNASVLTNRLKYIQIAQDSDRKIAFKVEQAKANYEEQKKLRVLKEAELKDLQVVLDQQETALNIQKGQKQRLLADTQNDERVYQNLINQLRAENAAIQGIVSGAGTESKIRDVSKGETIASIIGGPSCNSSGAHLHFIVQEGSTVVNPFSYLKQVDASNCSGSSCGSGDGDSFNPSGSWDWPLSPAIRFNQGYGETWAVRNTYAGSIYNFHNGIDITGASYSVFAVSDGTLYRGSFSGGGGCALPYVKLVHKDSTISTLYLHVYSN